MDISTSALWEDVLETLAKKEKRLVGDSVRNELRVGTRDVHFRYECEIVVDGEDEPIIPYKIVSIETTRVYATVSKELVAQYGDNVIITVLMDPRIVDNVIYPNQNLLSITIKKFPIFEQAEDDNIGDMAYVERYRAHLLIKRDEILDGNSEHKTDKDPLKQIPFQLINLSLDQLRLKSVGANYINMTMFNIIRGTYTREAGLLELPVDDKLKGVEIVEDEVNNDLLRPQTPVPQGTPLMRFLDFLQDEYGVYSTGAGHYIQGRWWYVYPEFNTKRFEESEYTMTVINVPKHRLPQVERTYYEDGDKIFVLSTGEVNHGDELEFNELNEGNGTRFLMANRIMDMTGKGFFFLNGEHEVEVDLEKNVRTFVVHPRETGFNNVRFSPDRVSANVLKHESMVSRLAGTLLRFTWNNADADLIKPGMPTKFLYLDKDEVKEKMGVVVAVNFTTHNAGIRGNDRFYQNASVLLFIEKEED